MNSIISIIIPVYNSEAFLEECLNSVLCQTYPYLQILCINDGSTDRSQRVLENFVKIDPRIKLINKENGGLSSARNKGLEAATGKYVMFLDSDDWLDPDVCRKAVQEMESAQVDLVMWSYIREYPQKSKPSSVLGVNRLVFDLDGVRNLHRRLFGLAGAELEDPSRGDIIVTAWGKLYKRDLIEGIRFTDTKEIGTEDCLYNIEVFNRLRSAVYIPMYGYHYRKYNSQSLTTLYNPLLYTGWQRLYELMENYILSHDLPEEYTNALLNRRAIHLIALGINIMSASMSPLWKYREIKAIIQQPCYRKAFQQLKLEDMPIHWKLFFLFAKFRFAAGVYLLLLVIQKIRGR